MTLSPSKTAKNVLPMGRTPRIHTEQGDKLFVEGYTAPALLVLIAGGTSTCMSRGSAS